MTLFLRLLLVVALVGAIVVMLWPATPEPPEPPLPPPAEVPAPPVVSAPQTEAPAAVSVPDTFVAVPAPLPSGLVIPVAGIGPEELVDTFAEARSENRSHDAIDIIAPRGTPVLAAAAGRIVRLFESDKGGLTIYQLADDDRTVYYYAHLDAYAEGLAAGTRVQQGDVIAYVGDTGNAVPGNYHLHFAIWTTDDPADFWGGPAVNPYPLLRGD